MAYDETSGAFCFPLNNESSKSPLANPNIQHAEENWPPVVIASAFTTGGLVARSLRRRGVQVFMVDSDQTLDGFRSAHGQSVVCPNADDAPHAWLQFMTEFATRFDKRPVLMAASDEYVSAIGSFATELGKHFRISSCAVLQAELAVKEGQVRLAQEHGLPIPHTRFATNEQEVREFADNARFPVIFKPRQHRFWGSAPLGHPMHLVKAVQSRTTEELLANYRLASAFAPEVILQETILGPDTNKRVHVGVYRRDGIRLGQLTLKELRSMHLGVPSVNEPINDAQISDISDRFFQAIGYRGTCEIEFMWDERDGKPKMIDINPRFTGAGDAVPYAGIDQAWLLYLDLLDKPVEPVSPAPRSFRHVMLENDMLSIRQYSQNGQMSWKALRDTYRWPVYFGDIELRDWRRTWPVVWRSLRTTIGTLGMILFGRRSRKIRSTEVRRITPVAVDYSKASHKKS